MPGSVLRFTTASGRHDDCSPGVNGDCIDQQLDGQRVNDDAQAVGFGSCRRAISTVRTPNRPIVTCRFGAPRPPPSAIPKHECLRSTYAYPEAKADNLAVPDVIALLLGKCCVDDTLGQKHGILRRYLPPRSHLGRPRRSEISVPIDDDRVESFNIQYINQ